MARPQIKIDYDKLKSLCHIQCTGEECASVLGIDYDTLNAALKRDGEGCFSDYFKKASAGGRASLRRKQFAMADNNPTMAIWLGKQYLNQSDKQELTGRDGIPLIPDKSRTREQIIEEAKQLGINPDDLFA